MKPAKPWSRPCRAARARLGDDLVRQHAAVAQAIAEVAGLAVMLDPAQEGELGRACRFARARLATCDPASATTPAAARRISRRLYSICADLLAEIVPL